jgi:hypothetical protein
VIHRDVEEALDLRSVQIDAEHPAHPCRLQEIGDEARADRRARRHLPVLPGVPVVGQHRRDRPRRSPPQRVNHDQELDQVVVHRRARGLDHVAVDATDILFDLAEHLAVAESRQAGRAEPCAQAVSDFLGQLAIGVPGE